MFKSLVFSLTILISSVLFSGCFHMGEFPPISHYMKSNPQKGPVQCWVPEKGVRVLVVNWRHTALSSRRKPGNVNTHVNLRLELLGMAPREGLVNWVRAEKFGKSIRVYLSKRGFGVWARFIFYPWWYYHKPRADGTRRGDIPFAWSARCYKGMPPGYSFYRNRVIRH